MGLTKQVSPIIIHFLSRQQNGRATMDGLNAMAIQMNEISGMSLNAAYGYCQSVMSEFSRKEWETFKANQIAQFGNQRSYSGKLAHTGKASIILATL